MTKLILEKKYLNSETKLFLGGYIYGDRIKFIWDSQQKQRWALKEKKHKSLKQFFNPLF